MTSSLTTCIQNLSCTRHSGCDLVSEDNVLGWSGHHASDDTGPDFLGLAVSVALSFDRFTEVHGQPEAEICSTQSQAKPLDVGKVS